MTRLAIVGAGDYGRTLLREIAEGPGGDVVAFYDDVHRGEVVDGVRVVDGVEGVADGHGTGRFDQAVMAIGYRHLAFRQRLFMRLQEEGVPFATLVHPSCDIAADACIAEGCVLFPGCTLDVGVEIGVNAVLNTGCAIAHDSRIVGHSFLGPGVTLAGYVVVGERCFVGVGTTVIDHVTIADDAQTAAGAVVVGDVEAGTLVMGVPAREARRVDEG